MARRRLERAQAGPGGQRPLLDRVRKRRLVDLLRANYVITIASSAFFAAGYLDGVAHDTFSTTEWSIGLGIALIVVLALVNVRGVKDAVAVNVVLAVVDFLSQPTLVLAGAFPVFSAELLERNLSFFGTAPTWQDVLIAIPVGTVRPCRVIRESRPPDRRARRSA